MRTSDSPPRAAAKTSRKPRLALSVQHATDAEGLPARSTLRRWIVRALDPAVEAASMTVRFVGTAEGRALNRRYRERDYPTNVLTFVYDRGAMYAGDAGNEVPPRDGASIDGDLVLCVPVLKREARGRHRTVREHCAHLVIHGTLHLQGHDHQNDKDATVMEALETRLLAGLGYRDPYEETR